LKQTKHLKAIIIAAILFTSFVIINYGSTNAEASTFSKSARGTYLVTNNPYKNSSYETTTIKLVIKKNSFKLITSRYEKESGETLTYRSNNKNLKLEKRSSNRYQYHVSKSHWSGLFHSSYFLYGLSGAQMGGAGYIPSGTAIGTLKFTNHHKKIVISEVYTIKDQWLPGFFGDDDVHFKAEHKKSKFFTARLKKISNKY
jgi:hypothetical protein